MTQAKYWDVATGAYIVLPPLPGPPGPPGVANTTVGPAGPQGSPGPGASVGFWFPVPFAANWTNYAGTAFRPCQYMQDSVGWVYLCGLAQYTGTVNAGVSSVNVGTLPAGFRPALNEVFSVSGGGYTNVGGPARLDVLSTGVLQYSNTTTVNATNPWLTLSGIKFIADNYVYSAAVRASNPIGYWPLDDAPAQGWAREPIANNKATLVGGITTVADPWSLNTAMTFDGTTGFGYSLGTYMNNSQGWAVECWYNTTAVAPNAGMLSSTSSPTTFPTGGGGFTPALYLDTTGHLTGFAFGMTTTVIADAATSNNGAWHHAVLTFDGTSTMTLFRDGAQVATTTGGVPQTISTFRLQFGTSGNTTRGGMFNGSLSSVAIYQHGFQLPEVQNHYSAAAG